MFNKITSTFLIAFFLQSTIFLFPMENLSQPQEETDHVRRSWLTLKKTYKTITIMNETASLVSFNVNVLKEKQSVNYVQDIQQGITLDIPLQATTLEITGFPASASLKIPAQTFVDGTRIDIKISRKYPHSLTYTVTHKNKSLSEN